MNDRISVEVTRKSGRTLVSVRGVALVVAVIAAIGAALWGK